MKLIIKDRLDNTFNLYEYNPRIEISKVGIEHRKTKRYSTSGVELNSIGSLEDREINIKITLDAENDTDYDLKINTICNFFNINFAPFYLIDLDNNKRAKIFFKSIKDNANEGLHKRVSLDTELSFIMQDGFFESVNETVVNAVLSNGMSVNININNDEFITYPIIEIENVSGTVCDDFFIRVNNLFGYYLIRIKELGFTNSKKIIIDNIEGTVLLNTISVNRSIVEGSFFKFIRGNNTLYFFFY